MSAHDCRGWVQYHKLLRYIFSLSKMRNNGTATAAFRTASTMV